MNQSELGMGFFILQVGGWGSLGVKFQIFQTLGRLYTKMKFLVSWLRKSGSRGHLTKNWGGFTNHPIRFRVIGGQNLKILEPGHVIY